MRLQAALGGIRLAPALLGACLYLLLLPFPSKFKNGEALSARFVLWKYVIVIFFPPRLLLHSQSNYQQVDGVYCNKATTKYSVLGFDRLALFHPLGKLARHIVDRSFAAKSSLEITPSFKQENPLQCR